MRHSHLFARTLRETPSDAMLPSHRLLLRAGMIQQMVAGIYSYLPLGWRVLRKIETIVREEMEAIGGQEILMPVVQPAELWRESGRYDAEAPGEALVRFQDRGKHDLVLAMTHEEAVTDLARRIVGSYRQLPLFVYHIQTKFRDETRARGGLIRVREFLMKDGYSFHADAEDLDDFYPRVYAAYQRIFERCGLAVVPVEAATAMMGGRSSHEFTLPNENGEDSLMVCEACGYAANVEAAQVGKGSADISALLPVEKVATPGTSTIQALATLLGVAPRQTLKAVFFEAQGQIVFAVVRGDLDISEAKLSAMLGGAPLKPASPELLNASGLVAGYASPVGIRGVRIVADDSIVLGRNYVAGANEPDYHLKNVNYPRDMAITDLADIALAREGDPCPHCEGRLKMVRGIEMGHIFKLGVKYSEVMGASYLDRDGQTHALEMGCYGIGLGRLLAGVVESHWDKQGIIWPVSVAPFDVHLISLAGRQEQVELAAEALYDDLRAWGYDVLYDDRDERAGVKFNDADLIGIPVRVIVSQRGLERGEYEVKARGDTERVSVPRAQIEGKLEALLA